MGHHRGEEVSVIKRLIVLALASFLLSGCATTGFLGFLATTKYVEGKVQSAATETRSQLAETQADLEQTRKEVQRMQELAGRIEGMQSEVSQMRKTSEELKDLVHELERRLAVLPDQTLRLLADLIQAHLSVSEKLPAE
jgi:septal ring factor EnvC (AmiA/AmiB activator)